MDKFRVGQMVRILNAPNRPELRGTVCTVITPNKIWDEWTEPHYGTDLVIDGIRIYAPEYDLAPVYDGDQKISWEECAWRPMDELAKE